MERLASECPDRRRECLEKILVVREHAYVAGQGRERADAGEALVQTLLELAEVVTGEGAFKAAGDYAGRALTVAKGIGSPRKAEAEACLAGAVGRERALTRVGELAERLRAQPDDAEARDELVRLRVADLDRPAEALKHRDVIGDEQTVRYLLLAEVSAARLPERACLEMGDWYRAMADRAGPHGRSSALRRAQACYKAYVEKHGTDDLWQTKAAVALAKVEALLDASGGPVPATADDVAFFGVSAGGARRMVFVVDRSRSMFDWFDYIRAELKATIGALDADREFHVIFFSSGEPSEMAARRLVKASDASKKTAMTFIDTAVPKGETDPMKAIERAFAVEPDLVYFLTDGEFRGPHIERIRELNRDGKVVINTIAVLYRTGEKALKAIAAENRGRYQFVSQGELESSLSLSPNLVIQPSPGRRLWRTGGLFRP